MVPGVNLDTGTCMPGRLAEAALVSVLPAPEQSSGMSENSTLFDHPIEA